VHLPGIQDFLTRTGNDELFVLSKKLIGLQPELASTLRWFDELHELVAAEVSAGAHGRRAVQIIAPS
jgi:hypothetical protein